MAEEPNSKVSNKLLERVKGKRVDEGTLEWLREQIAQIDSPEGFRRRLEVSECIYAYVVKEFGKKFPAEAMAWVTEFEDQK